MKFEAADLPRISLGIVGLVLMVALGVGAILAASRVDTLAVKARDEAQRQQEALDGGATDWQAAMREWEQWEENRKTGNHALEE